MDFSNTPRSFGAIRERKTVSTGKPKRVSRKARSVRIRPGQRRRLQGNTSGEPVPYHGYYYRILTAQGKDAAGGAYSYLVKGKMIGGFAVVAYPAEYENSGVMTFIVNYEGKVFQKDLGKNTASVAKAMKEYNPDKTWTEVKP